MIHKIIYTLLMLSAVFFVQSCRHDEDEPIVPKPVEQEMTGRTVLVYILSAGSGLDSYRVGDMKEMRDAAINGDITDGRLIIFHSSNDGNQVLQEMRSDGTLDTLKVYDPIIRPQTSQRMSEVIVDMKKEAPAKDYGLILWGHGSGWLEDGVNDPANVAQTYSYGGEYNGKYWMNMTSLARILDGVDFSFIYFDCCYMASVEAMYQLRNVTPYIVASSAEVMGWGMPYDRNIKHFFATEPELVEAARNTYDYYQDLGDNHPELTAGEIKRYGYCTLTVINTAGLDKVAAATRSIYEGNTTGLPQNYTPQSFTQSRNLYYCDLGSYVKALSASDDQKIAFDDAMSEAIIAKFSTERIYGTIDVREHSGLTTFIMEKDEDSTVKNYHMLDWYYDVASSLVK